MGVDWKPTGGAAIGGAAAGVGEGSIPWIGTSSRPTMASVALTPISLSLKANICCGA